MRSMRWAAAAALALASSVFVIAQESAPKIINGGVLNGKAVSLPRPEYPDTARKARVEGAVRVEIIIDEDGNIEAAKAVKEDPSGSEMAVEVVDGWEALRSAAESAALEARFSPTLLSGVPVKVRGSIVYNFSLTSRSEETEKLIDGGVINGKAIELPNASYPAAARAVNASGVVTVRVTVDENGNVISARAISGHPLLQSAAVSAARGAKFLPTSLDGQPIKFSGIITYNFVLSTKQQ